MVAVAAAIRESRGRLGGSGLQDRVRAVLLLCVNRRIINIQPSQLISNFNQSQGRMRILGLKHRDYSIKQRGPTYAEGEGSEDDKNFSKVVG